MLAGSPLRYNDPKTREIRSTAPTSGCEPSGTDNVPQAEHKTAKSSKDGSETAQKAAFKFKDFPDRIRIKSIALIRVLEDINGGEVLSNMDAPYVVLKPFKLLLHFQEEIRAKLKTLEQKWSLPAKRDSVSVDGVSETPEAD